MAIKQKISVVVVATALMSAIPFIIQKEGDVPEAYLDTVGVWTICGGETQGVNKGDKLTKEQCKLLTQSRIGQFMMEIVDVLQVSVPANVLAAHTSFAYNIGLNGYKSSKALKLTNAGDLRGGCLAMGNWYTAGGRDCRIKSNGCYGVVNRRNEEIKLCLSGLQ